MSVYICTNCGFEKEAKCKPRKCPSCGEKGTFVKKDSTNTKKSKK